MNGEKRAGDRGMTTLSGNGMVAKSDERIDLIGTIEELNCYIGIIRADASCSHLQSALERIQKTLRQICEGVRVQYARESVPPADEITFLEHEIERLETETADAVSGLSGRDGDHAALVLPGANKESAVFELAAAISRRAERVLITVDRRYGVRAESRVYMNRLADYFDQAAIYRRLYPSQGKNPAVYSPTTTMQSQMEHVVRQVISELGAAREITLTQAKQVIEAVEEAAARRGTSAVICICNAHGNPVAVHVMDGAFLVSFDAAQKKAYTSAAVKMSTLELAKLAAPGQTFYGVDRLDDGKITLIGGGHPLMRDGILCGAIGVSGGTGEEDDELAAYGIDVYQSIY